MLALVNKQNEVQDMVLEKIYYPKLFGKKLILLIISIFQDYLKNNYVE